jgi:hypothetical protein
VETTKIGKNFPCSRRRRVYFNLSLYLLQFIVLP